MKKEFIWKEYIWIAFAWLWAGIPLIWGISQTVIKASALFQ